jgi:hypothetical protein
VARANEAVTQVRTALENATAALVRAEYIQRITRLRVRQASEQGMAGLLEPALGEMDEIAQSVQAAKAQVSAATKKIVEYSNAQQGR